MPYTGGPLQINQAMRTERNTQQISSAPRETEAGDRARPGPAGGESLVRVPDRSAGMNDE